MSALEESFGKLKNVFTSSGSKDDEDDDQETHETDEAEEKGFFSESVKTVRYICHRTTSNNVSS